MVVVWSSARRVVAILGLCAGLAAAAGLGAIGVRAQRAADETTGSAGPVSTSHFALSLTDEERHRIYRGLTRFPDASSADGLDVADKVPSGASLEDLPATVTADIPLLRGHKFLKLEDRILLVEPSSRIVVAMIPRYKLLP
jgi:hypothetical protein